MMNVRKTVVRLVAGSMISLASVGAVTTVTAPPAQAARCADCTGGGGGGGGGGGAPSDSAHYAMYLISISQLNGSLLRDNDQIVRSISPTTAGYVQFRLHAEPNLRWWKEIKVFNSAGQAVGQDYTQDDKKDTVTLTFRTQDLNGASLVLSKAKAFGVHTGVYEVHNLQSLDGTVSVLDWQRDG
jgi:hypothetical protein